MRETDAAEGGCGNILHLEPQRGRRKREVILFEGLYQPQASVHIVRSLLKCEENASFRGEKTH